MTFDRPGTDSGKMNPMDWAKLVIRSRSEREYAEVYSYLVGEARRGNAEAEYNLGMMYARGQGVPKNYEAAFSWFQKAHEKGHPGATFFMGKMFANGIGVEKDPHKAERMFQKCSSDPRAQYEIGLLYFKEDMPRDLDMSARWMLRAAREGNTEAQFVMGQFYKSGAGVPANIKEAVDWLTSAAINGHRGAQILLGNMYRTGDGVEVDRDESDRWYDMADSENGS